MTPANQISGDQVSCLAKNKIVSKEMCVYCFDTLIDKLKRQSRKHKPTFPNESYPLFVTWSVGPEHHLRGCIGTFSPYNLHEGLSDYALKSALEDSRFPPISLNELSKLNVAVSVLFRFEQAANYLDWNIGMHGIQIEFKSPEGYRRSATYLPEVASEHGWTREQAIDSLIRKAGYRGQIHQSIRDSVQLTRYQSEKLCLTYDEYRRYRDL